MLSLDYPLSALIISGQMHANANATSCLFQVGKWAPQVACVWDTTAIPEYSCRESKVHRVGKYKYLVGNLIPLFWVHSLSLSLTRATGISFPAHLRLD